MSEREKILVVDDEEEIRDIISEILLKENYEIDVAVNGVDAIEKLHKKEYNLVLTDLKMPKIGGLEVIEEAKLLYKDIVTIIMTAYGTLESAVEALKLGAHDYISKPFHTTTLVNVIKKSLSAQKLIREN